MSDARLRGVVAGSLTVGAVLGMVGTFVSDPDVRAVAWGLDGTLLCVGSALLAAHHARRGDELLTAGFLVYLAGQTLVVSGSAMSFEASGPTFAAGAALWAASLMLVSASPAMPLFVRVTGAIAALLFAVTAVRMLGGAALTPLSRPLPYAAFPFLVLTLFGWAWVHVKGDRGPGSTS